MLRATFVRVNGSHLVFIDFDWPLVQMRSRESFPENAGPSLFIKNKPPCFSRGITLVLNDVVE